MFTTNRKPRSINFIIIRLFLMVLCPITFANLAANYYTKSILQTQATDYNRGTLSVHIETVDTRLENLSRSMFLLLYQEINVSNLLQTEDMNARIDEQLNMKRTLSNYFSAYDNTDGLFIYSPSTNDYIQSSKGNESIQDRTTLKNYMKNVILSTDYLGLLEGVWKPITLNQKCLLIKVIQKDGVFLGSWIWVESLIEPLKNLEGNSGTRVFVTDSTNRPLTNLDFISEEGIQVSELALSSSLSSSSGNYLTIGVPSSMGNINLCMSIPYKEVMQKTVYFEILILSVYIISLVLMVIIYFQFKKQIIQPMNALKDGMGEIKKGNLDIMLTVPKDSLEIGVVTDTFNDMAKDIKSLKIQVYEEQLEKSRILLRSLNLQIRPHFFLNSLNIIYSLALTKDYKLILDMSKCLTTYIRYIFKSSDSMVLIQEELMHINNYMHIQELRYTTRFTTNTAIEPGLDNIYIPILLIQTFVENSIKHAYHSNVFLEVDIKVKNIKDASDSYVEIIISNNGNSFSKEQLDELNASVNMSETREEHLGILNIKQRLHLIYQGKARLQFSNNNSGGTIVVIKIPKSEKGT
ncbi:MAG: putative sensor with domain [Herbinix sp.]|nr:putative sensor with domain [Herbinix sp.]